MINEKLNTFISIFSESFENNIISKLTISLVNNKIIENSIIINNINSIINTDKINISEIKIIFVNPVRIKSETKLSFNFRFKTKDIVQNYSLSETKVLLENLLGFSFLQADLFCLTNSYHLVFDKKLNSKLIEKQITTARNINLDHNRTKVNILIEGATNYSTPFLSLLGVFSEDGKLKNDKRDKFKQINKYLEFFAQAIKESTITDSYKIIDMGSGKGYLTFAMYDFVSRILKKNIEIIGIEYRADMVDLCNHYALKAGFTSLAFKQGTIENSKLDNPNVLIALHACDTATDEAIYKGIQANVEVMMLSPCCHKQIRKQLKPQADLVPMLKNGIIIERQAELLTDVIRTLLLEAYGYQTKIFEFIDAEHTPKNLMITAIKKTQSVGVFEAKLQEVKKIKTLFGIEYHYLEKLLNIVH